MYSFGFDIILNLFTGGGCGSSRVRYKYIGCNIYTAKRSNLRSKPTPIHGPVHKYYLNDSYSISHFSRLPQAVTKKTILSFVSEN